MIGSKVAQVGSLLPETVKNCPRVPIFNVFNVVVELAYKMSPTV